MLPRHLAALRHGHHVVAHGDQDGAQIVARPAELPDERAGVGRVAAVPVEGDVAGLGGEADQRADARLGGGEPAADIGGAGAHGPRKIARERVVAAGVEEQDIGLRLPLHRALDEVEPDHLEVERRGGICLRVDRDQVVLPAHLQPVPGVEEEADGGTPQRAGELGHLAVEGGLVEVDAFDDLEVELAQRGGHIGGVVLGIGRGAACR